MKTISVAEARAIDQDAVERLGMPSILLMENAARGLAEVAREMGDSWLIYCGPGNNGGDGMAAARHLGRGARVFLTAAPDPEKCPDAALQLKILRAAGHPVSVGEVPPNADADEVLIDAMFGTGLTRALDGDVVVAFVEQFNRSPGRKLCVDIPSGLDGDTGLPLDSGSGAGPVCVGDETVTFAAAKQGLLVRGAEAYVGEVIVVGLGLPEEAPSA